MAVSQTNFAWATLLDVGPAARGRLHDRLAQALRTAIRDGRLPEGAALPPSRALAEELGCSRWVVTEAYGQLTAEGYLTARVGSATRVSWVPDSAPHTEPLRLPAVPPVRYDLSPGLPDLRAFPRRRWAEAVRAVVGSAVHHDLGLPDPAGHAAPRTTIAQYLRRSRGADAHPSSVIICAGITDGLVRTCRALRASGISDVAVEHPGWPRLRAAATSAGLRVHPVPVDEDGLRVDDLAATPARAVVVGAAHQFPTGTVLSPARRARLVAPGAMAAALRAANPVASAPPVLDQFALATFIDRGWYDAHLRAARRRYRTRRDLLVHTLAEEIPEGRVAGTAAGLHILLHLPDHTDTSAVVHAATAVGLSVSDLDDYRTEPSTDRALVLGYGNIGDTEIPAAVTLLRDSIRASMSD